MVSQNLDQYFFVFRLHQGLHCLGNAANASSVGAKIVNGPFPDRVSVKPAACKADVRVLKEPFDATTATTLSLKFHLLAPQRMALRRGADFWGGFSRCRRRGGFLGSVQWGRPV